MSLPSCLRLSRISENHRGGSGGGGRPTWPGTPRTRKIGRLLSRLTGYGLTWRRATDNSIRSLRFPPTPVLRGNTRRASPSRTTRSVADKLVNNHGQQCHRRGAGCLDCLPSRTNAVGKSFLIWSWNSAFSGQAAGQLRPSGGIASRCTRQSHRPPIPSLFANLHRSPPPMRRNASC